MSQEILYLRGLDFPDSKGSYAYARTGKECFYVNANHTIIVLPAITYHCDSVHERIESPHLRITNVLKMMQNGDNPPPAHKILIRKDNGQALPLNSDGYEKHVVVTSDFEVDIPNYENSNQKYLGNYLDVKLDQPGPTRIVVGGTFILFRLEEGSYTVTWASNGENGYLSSGTVMIKSVTNSNTTRLYDKIRDQSEKTLNQEIKDQNGKTEEIIREMIENVFK